ncbi:MAG TPA: hypothetical protein VFZ53_13480, partial [Polyangiaceae bacterium]
MIHLRHIVPLFLLTLPFACSKDRPAESPSGAEYTPASGDATEPGSTGTDAGSSMPSDMSSGGTLGTGAGTGVGGTGAATGSGSEMGPGTGTG